MRNQAIIGVLTVATTVLYVSQVKAQTGVFSDVPANHWAAASVQRLVSQGIIAAPQKQTAKPTPAFSGDKPVTRYELAVALDRFVQYVERADKQKKSKFNVQATPESGATAAKRLIAAGYLPANTPLATDNAKIVTAAQLSKALSSVLIKITDKKTPISPDSEFAPERPQENSR